MGISPRVNLQPSDQRSHGIDMAIALPPPRCLQGVHASPAAAPDILLDTYTESPNRFFRLACQCGGERWVVIGQIARHTLIDQDVVVGPTTARCAQCECGVVVFDPALHGYDVEIDHFPPLWQPPRNPREFTCPTCSGTVFALTARFEYPADLLTALESGVETGYDERHRGKEQDLFTFFTLVGHCCGCTALVTIASVECA